MTTNVNPRDLGTALAFLFDNKTPTYAEEMRKQIALWVKKWSPFLSHVKTPEYELPPIDPKLWPMMAMMFENQIMANPKPRSVYEATTKTTVALPVKHTLPIIRSVFPSLIMNKICSVQPMPKMSGGTMQIFWMNIYREDVSPATDVVNPDSDYALSEENAVPKRLRMDVVSDSVTAEKDILNATWSTEIEEDAMGALGIDVEREMLDAMGGEILREHEERVLNEILAGATAGNVNWAWTMGGTYTSHTDWYQTLHHAFIDAEQNVRTNRHRRCNYIVCGLTVVSYVRKASWFQADQGSGDPAGPISSGVVREGRVGLWDIYSTPYINANVAIVSYYPETMLHAGYVWSPYIPLAPMPKVYAEMLPHDDAVPGALVNRDKWNRNVRTRNAKRMVQPNMFATVTIAA